MRTNPLSRNGFLIPRVAIAVFLCLAAISLTLFSFAGTGPKNASSAQTPPDIATPAAQHALSAIRGAGQPDVKVQVSRQTGYYAFVQAPQGAVLAKADAAASPQARALAFLSTHGALVGMSSAERAAASNGSVPPDGSDLQIVGSEPDHLGSMHVRFDQSYKGLKVFGAQVIVHMNGEGITAVNGGYVPHISLSTVPTLSKQAASEAALAVLRKGAADAAEQKVERSEAAIYPSGLLEGQPVVPRLAYSVDVRGPEKAEQIWIDAQNGVTLARVPLHQDALNRTIYSPQYDPENPDLFVQRREGDPPHPTPFVNNLYDFAGQTYNFYASAFGRDSYDAKGHHMISVYLINQQCPNAYWNGTSTNYCPAFDADDVVSHEWSHAYTQFTHGLIYSFQSGALNESYSDIFGESVDLLNKADGIGGSDNDKPFPDGQRWLVGEDLGEEAQQLLLRDMYDPDREGAPGKVSSPNYFCGTTDGGGVHTNSGVPNHGYALTVDGTKFKPADPTIGQAAGTYNGQKITGIGITKAAAIYYRAETVYQTPTTGFPEHDAAIQKSCSDLIGAELKEPTTEKASGAISNAVITADDCQQVAKVMLAVEMSKKPPCSFGPLLSPDPAPICDLSTTIFSEDWESGENGWTKTSSGFGTGTIDWEDASKDETRFFHVRSDLPGNHPGSAAFADNPKTAELGGGTCMPGGDYSGSHTLTSPEIVIPAGVNSPQLSFEHYVATETGVDGGQVEISVNGGSFTLVPQSAYRFNGPNSKFTDASPVGNNTGPNPGEIAWTGTNLGNAILGSWGTTVADLSSLAQAGDTVKLRWTWSQDGCNGVEGWYVDNIRVFSCPVLKAPVLQLGGDYEKPDSNGKFTLNWTRPPGATGPDDLQVSETSCAPVIADDAENGLAKWNTSATGGGAEWTTSTKPQHESTTFSVQGMEATTNADSYLTYKDPIAIPAGGETYLNFTDWDLNEGDDNVYVEASQDDGATWQKIYSHNRSETGTGPVAFATEDLFPHTVNLAFFGGKTIRLRFHYALGAENRAASTPFGWYVDNISIDNEDWQDVATTAGTSFHETRSSGSYCYRVRTTYTANGKTAPGDFSNIVNATVVPGINFDGSKLLNISTRARVGTDDNILIGGFIVTGTANKPVILRAIGPSLAVDGVPIPGRLEDPKLELFDRTGTLIAKNDDWRKSPQAEKIQSSGFAPKSDAESVIVRNLPPGAYTTHLKGKNNGTGIGLVEAYDLAPGAKSKLANLSTRGFVGANDNVMIAGFTAGAENGDTGVLLRAIGPSLKPQVQNTVSDPTLVLKDQNGATLAANDNWRNAEAKAIENTGLAPTNNAEAAILITLPPGPYTAIMRGKNNTTGLGLIEAYNVSLTTAGGK